MLGRIGQSGVVVFWSSAWETEMVIQVGSPCLMTLANFLH